MYQSHWALALMVNGRCDGKDDTGNDDNNDNDDDGNNDNDADNIGDMVHFIAKMMYWVSRCIVFLCIAGDI